MFPPKTLSLLSALCVAASVPLSAQDRPGAAGSSVPLYSDLGDHHYAITTASPAAQSYFDQGFRLYYAFNHQEAIRSFREAQRLDGECAMCWWGEALSWGPNINLPMDSASAVAAYAAVREAVARREHASERERAFIEALAVRYAPVPPADRAHLDRAYAEAMGEVAARYPADDEAQTLYAEALMDLRPWDYWTSTGEPREGIAAALAGLERVIDRDEQHPGACHFFIHAVEEVYPERAVPCAERLAGLMPGAGHLVHMPGHIYIRVGRYLDAVQANEHAVHADETYIRDQNPAAGMYTAGYYPHNYDFMAFAASMIGRSADAIASAEEVAGLIPGEMMGAAGMGFLQHWSTRPLQFLVRFARWDEILAEPAPASSLPHARALWHYARGRALAATGDPAGARAELEAIRAIRGSAALDGLRMEFNASSDLLSIADHVLAGSLAGAEGLPDEAVRHLGLAVEAEDALLYGEPPEWSVPTRQELGAALLRAGRAAEAERTFRADLERFPENGWSLHGLAAALRDQGRTGEASAIDAELRRVWATADVELAELTR